MTVSSEPVGRAAFVLPGPIDTPTGGFRYDRRIVRGLVADGWAIDVHELPATFPTPTEDTRRVAAEVFARLPAGTTTLVDGLAFGVLPELAVEMHTRLALVALVHHPLALESGLDATTRDALFASERRALATATRVIVPSPATARALEPYGVPSTRIRIVPPGQDPAPLAPGSGTSTPRLLCVASLVPRKGHATLLAALARLTHLDWSLVCVGSDTLDVETARALRVEVTRLSLADRVRFTGAADPSALDAWYRCADAFVLATRYEGYGMVFDEAIARGLPIIASGDGAVGDTLPADGAVHVPVDDPDALAAALETVLIDADHRRRLAAGARRARARRRHWSEAVTAFARVLEEAST